MAVVKISCLDSSYHHGHSIDHHRVSRKQVQRVKQPKGLGLLDNIKGVFSNRSEYQQKGKQLFELLQNNSNMDQIEELVDELSVQGSKFKEQMLGQGPWTVRFTKGKTIPWLAQYKAAKKINQNNKAYQCFDPQDRSVVNAVEYFGQSVKISASGNYEPVEISNQTPIEVGVQISQGQLDLWGLTVPLPINGKATFKILYVDDYVRIFQSREGLLAVQVRVDLL